MEPGAAQPSSPPGADQVPHHLSVEYFSWEYRVRLVTAGFGVYTAVFLLSHVLSMALSHTYNSLLAKEKVFWNLAVTRGMFGLQSVVAGLRTLTEDSMVFRDRVQGQEDWSWFHLLTATGFFMFENVALHTSSLVFWSFDISLAVHHFFALAGYLAALVWDSTGHFLPMVTLLMEMSTPFTCISWLLLKAGYARTLFWKANQWVMIHMFHCRMVLSYYMWYFSATHWSDLNTHVSLPQRLIFFPGLVLLTFVLNPIWTHKKTMQLLNPVDWNFANKTVPLNGPKGKPHSN